MRGSKLQSAMEYLMTYGWAILIVAVVLGALYQLGIFGTGASALAPACLASAGFLCQNPTMNTSGYLGIKFGQLGSSSITITNIACTTNTTTPSSSQQMSLTLTSGATTNLAVLCPVGSNSIGAPFKGYLWLTYSTPAQSAVVDRIAVVTAKIATTGGVLSSLGGGGTVGSSILGYIYCVPDSSQVGSVPEYSAPLTSTGIGTWSSTGSIYPGGFWEGSCSIYNGYIYCVGDAAGSDQQTYYAQITSSGVLGSWTAGTTFPVTVVYPPCTAYNGYMYCAQGIAGTFYYASISSSGFGSWATTNGFGSSFGGSCSISGGYIYCVGGSNANDIQVNTAQVFSSGGGVSTWTQSTAYPTDMQYNGCSIANGNIYCTGSKFSPYSATYYAGISSGTVGAWTATSSPGAAQYVPCVQTGGYMYCVGSSAVYATINSVGLGTFASTTAPPVTMSRGSCQIPGSGGGLFGGGGPD